MRTMKMRRWAMMVAAVALLVCATTVFSQEATRPNDQSQGSNQRSSAQSRRAPQAHHGAQQRGSQGAAQRQDQRSVQQRGSRVVAQRQGQRSTQQRGGQEVAQRQGQRSAQQRGGQEAAPRQGQRSARERSIQQAQQRQVWQQHRLASGEMPGNWEQRGGYHGRQIPSAFFSGHFGVQHRFRVYSLPFQVISGRPQFQFNGYWFEVADPVPAYWGPDWYENDDVFIVYAYGGYYLNNARFPNRPGIAISVNF